MTCPGGTKFNAFDKACVVPSDSRCEEALRGFGVPVPKVSVPTAELAKPEPPKLQSLPIEPKEPLPSDNLDTEKTVKICKSDAQLFEISYVPNTSDCGSFYQCFGRDPALLHCPPGTKFNSKILACDYPEKAVCAKK